MAAFRCGAACPAELVSIGRCSARGFRYAPRRALARPRDLLNLFRWYSVGGGSNLNGACSNLGPKRLLAIPAAFQ